MKRVIFVTSALITLTGCNTIQQQPQSFDAHFIKANQEISLSSPSTFPISNNNFKLQVSQDPAITKAYNEYLKTGVAPDIVTDGFVVFAYDSNQQPIIATAPFALTVISLEPGEKFTNVTPSDNRWSCSIAVSGSGSSIQYQVLIKPPAPNTSANFIITTNKRMYDIKAVSTAVNGKYDRDVKFWYPDEIQANLENQNAVQSEDIGDFNSDDTSSNINLSSLNFNYSISNSFFNSPSWKPLQAFDDGTHTYIKFPPSISNEDMPALFIQNGKTKELVNYRSKPPYFVVDKIFKQAILVLGVGSSQTSITISNNNYY